MDLGGLVAWEIRLVSSNGVTSSEERLEEFGGVGIEVNNVTADALPAVDQRKGHGILKWNEAR